MDASPSNTPRNDRSIPDLVRDLRDQTTDLLKQEIELAKTELAEKGAVLGRNAMFLAVGGFVAYAGLLLLLVGIAIAVAVGLETTGLSYEMARCLGFLLVGILVGVVGFFLVQKALRTLRSESIKPEKTLQSLKEDKAWIQHTLQKT